MSIERHDHPGLFIAVEGLGGSGASNLSSLLAHSLEKDGYRIFCTEEPTNHLIGGLIRAVLSKEWESTPETLQLLFTADRAEHLDRQILPALEAGKIVITNRYAFSSIAYGSLEIRDPQWLADINQRFVLPDLTFLIKVQPKICAMRLKESHYELELYREEQKLQQVWRAYEELAESHSTATIISGERTQQEILHEMKSLVLKKLSSSDRDVNQSPPTQPSSLPPKSSGRVDLDNLRLVG